MLTSNHLLSSEYERFLDYAVAQGQCLEPLNLLDDGLPLLVRHYEFGLNSWPVFVSPQQTEALALCGVSIPLLFPKLLRVAFGSDSARMAEFYGVTREHAALALELLDTADIEGTLITRSDAVMTSDGLKTLEINFGAIGGWQIQFLDQQYRKQPSLKHFIESLDQCSSRDILREFYCHMVAACDRLEGRGEDEMTWLLVFPELFFKLRGDKTLTDMLERFAAEEGRRLKVLFSMDLEGTVVTDQTMFYKGRRIDMLLVGPRRVRVPEELAVPYRASRLVWLGNPVVKLFDDKRNLALLYTHRNDEGFTDEDRRLIERFIPWTAVAAPASVAYRGAKHDLRELLTAHQNDFVIKHARGSRGEGVVVGRFVDANAWCRALDVGFESGAYIVQAYCESLSFQAQGSQRGCCEVDFIWGVFGYGQTYGGSWIRMMRRDKEDRDGVINSACGAEETIVYEVAR